MNRKGIYSGVILVFFVLIVSAIALLLWMASRSSPQSQVETTTPPDVYGEYGDYGNASHGEYGSLDGPYGYGMATSDPYAPNEEFLEKQQEWEKRTGRKSAITLYAQIAPPDVIRSGDENYALLSETAISGWTAESEALVPFFPEFEECFALIRQGAERENADQFESGWVDPSMNAMSLLIATKMMTAHSLWLAEQGETDQAVKDLMAVVKMGHALRNKNATTIFCLIGSAFVSSAARPVLFILEDKGVAPESLAFLVNAAESIDTGRCHLAAPSISLAEFYLEDFKSQLEEEEAPTQEERCQTLEAMKKEIEILREIADTRIERLFGDKADLLEPPTVSIGGTEEEALPTMSVVRNGVCRETLSHAEVRLIGAAASLLLEFSQTGANSTSPPEAFPDPFTGKPFLYDPDDAEPFELRSVGPDLVPNADRVVYDPTNGSFSAGDIFFGKRKP